MTPPAIGIVPYGLRPGPDLARVALAELDFPLGLPDRLAGGRIGDLGPEDHLIFHPRTGLYLRRNRDLRARISLKIAEPRAVHGHHMRLLRLFHRRFFRILTRDRALLAAIPNGVFHNHTYSFLDDPLGVDTTKSRTCSLIASSKRDLEGHRLRHRIVERIRAEGLGVEVIGRGYAPFGAKEEGLAPYRYSVVIENSREPGYLTEKLIDAALCRTVPIYWGAPDVGTWFDPAGMILCDSEDEIALALAGLGGRDHAAFAAGLEANRARALALREGDRLAAEALLREIA